MIDRTVEVVPEQEAQQMSNLHVELVHAAIPLWYANVAWAKELLVRAFKLADAQDILSPQHRRRVQQIPNTCWFVCPHGIGVDIFKTREVGGIDFDFNKPDPGVWRLSKFIVGQVNDGQLSYEVYRELVDDEVVMESAVRRALSNV